MLASLETALKERFKEKYQLGELQSKLTVDQFEKSIFYELKNTYGFIQLADVATFESQIYFVLVNLEFHKKLIVTFPLNHHYRESISDIYPSASWYEREYVNQFIISDHKKLSPLFVSKEHPELNGFKRDLSVSEEIELSREYLEVGPLGPHGQNIAKIGLELDGDRICRLEFLPGFHRIALEDSLRTKSYLQIPSLLESYFAPYSVEYAFSWYHAIELKLNLSITERAQAIRMVLLELSRISGHLYVFERVFSQFKVDIESFQLLGFKNSIHSLFNAYNKSQYGEGIIKLGGVCSDLPVGWISKCLSVLSELSKSLHLLKRSFTNSNHWMSKTKTFEIEATDALSYGLTGPSLRSSGINYDLRKVDPFYFYNEVQFEIPLGINGTNYDRYLVRLEEIFQSIQIILQVLDNLPLGESQTGPLRDLEELRKVDREQYIEKVRQGIVVESDLFYSSIEGTNGELGQMFIGPISKNSPAMVKLRTPSYSQLQSLETLLKDASLVDLSTSFSIFGIETREVDR
ncbi:NADH-quinone oxidoreductase subunit C [Halobacteriovorax sp. GB3]|uniref:NADH-quinone oxidoreductase subunit D-related protein n=1 Tax=Halobacteriovorax sp. GB3 TaxID=2719615 RepID=UPI0023617C33|nr:NADH-quinone oxidoreductase subunit C [Halobacteriovorax sp. GB3]MDD0853520.1 NADH-quinone oxidoreductase subunit C [Halobacteriovorax sp. GB3]